MIPKLNYCNCNLSNTSTCSNLAKYKVKLHRRKEVGDVHLQFDTAFRCEEHKLTGTTGKKVFESIPYEQEIALKQVNDYLKSLIGKMIKSKVHTAKQLEVKYLKDNGGIMCLQPITKKWKFVYYNQIII